MWGDDGRLRHGGRAARFHDRRLQHVPGPGAHYRWGYGWPYGRGYQALNDTEKAQAADLRAAYLEHNPTLVCTPQDLSQRAGE